jgi:hypothetical protein
MTMSLFGKLRVGALALSLVLFAGCRAAPIYEVVSAPIPAPAGKVLTLDDVQKAIARGATRSGWQLQPEAPGHLTARFQSGRHSAMVNIDHDTKAYSIKMRETSVRNDGTSVHPAYNTWVQNLDRAIRIELSSIGQ